MRIKFKISLTFDRQRLHVDEDPGPQPEGSFTQAELAGLDPGEVRMPTGFSPPEGRHDR